jgi:hypothetical protein
MAATSDHQRWATPEPESATPAKTQIDFVKSPVPIGSSYIYIYNHYPTHLAGAYPNVRYIFQGVFGGGLEHVSVRFEGIWTTFPTKTTPGGRSATNFTFEWGPKKCILHFGMAPLKSSLKRVLIIYIYTYVYI